MFYLKGSESAEIKKKTTTMIRTPSQMRGSTISFHTWRGEAVPVPGHYMTL